MIDLVAYEDYTAFSVHIVGKRLDKKRNFWPLSCSIAGVYGVSDLRDISLVVAMLER